MNSWFAAVPAEIERHLTELVEPLADAAGIAAGAVALLMEWVLADTEAWGVNSSQIRNIILLGTEQRPGMESPNKEWGYGAMNLYRSLDILRQL